MRGQPGTRHAHRQRQAAAQPHNRTQRLRFRRGAVRAHHAAEKFDAGLLVQRPDLEEVRAVHGEPGEPPACCRDNQARWSRLSRARSGEKGTDLRCGRRVVEQGQHSPPAGHRPVQAGLLVQGQRDPFRRRAQGGQETGQHLTRPRRRVRQVPVQVGVEQAAFVAVTDTVQPARGQRRLA
jgi:hypothetical protein